MRAYLVLIGAFVDGSLTADQFMPIYLELFKNDPGDHSETEYQLLDTLFGDVDACNPVVDDPDAEPDSDWIGAAQLQQRAAATLERLVTPAD